MGRTRTPGGRPGHRMNASRLLVESLESRELLADGITASSVSPIMAQPGVAIANAVFATYVVIDSSGQPGTQFRAKVSFGDGQVDKNVVPVQVASGFQVFDSHTYAAAGTYTVTTMIAVPGSHRPNDNVVTTEVVVGGAPPPPPPPPAPPPPKPTLPSSIGRFGIVGTKLQAKVFKTYFGYVGYFHEPNSKASNFHAIVDWGDGSKKKPAHIVDQGGGHYGLDSQHRYVKPGVYTIKILLSDGRNRKIVTESLVRVLR